MLYILSTFSPISIFGVTPPLSRIIYQPSEDTSSTYVRYTADVEEVIYPDCEVDRPHWIGDGYCDDAQYNIEECGWDGGDCCSCTCVSALHTCGENRYDCLDPACAPAPLPLVNGVFESGLAHWKISLPMPS